MTTLRTTVVLSMATVVGACSTVPPVPVRVDASAPALVESHGLRARLGVLSRAETDLLFGGHAVTRIGVLELKVENRGTMPASIERKAIRLVTPDRQDLHPLSPLGVANLTRPGAAMISTGSNVIDAVQLIFGLAKLAQNAEDAAQWNHLMPETFKVAAGEEGRMLLAFSTPHWAPGLWRLELPFNADASAGALGPQLSVPLAFKVTESRNGATATGSRPLDDTGIFVSGGAGKLDKVEADSSSSDFTKIANDGSALPETAVLGDGAKDWACTRDNVRGLMWEIKTASGQRDQSNRYTWYDSNAATNGGNAGTAGGGRGSCGAWRCDTEKYVQDVNATGLCGHNDWRMPKKEELVSNARISPAIAQAWFPNSSKSFWSASTYAKDSRFAWDIRRGMNFDGPPHIVGSYMVKHWALSVRLVRAGQ